MDPCPGISGDITRYLISFQAGSFENVNITDCTAGRCSHTFEPPSNPPSSYDNVSVAAENVVGVGAPRTCTTQSISELTLKCFSYTVSGNSYCLAANEFFFSFFFNCET